MDHASLQLLECRAAVFAFSQISSCYDFSLCWSFPQVFREGQNWSWHTSSALPWGAVICKQYNWRNSLCFEGYALPALCAWNRTAGQYLHSATWILQKLAVLCVLFVVAEARPTQCSPGEKTLVRIKWLKYVWLCFMRAKSWGRNRGMGVCFVALQVHSYPQLPLP